MYWGTGKVQEAFHLRAMVGPIYGTEKKFEKKKRNQLQQKSLSERWKSTHA